MALIVFPEGQQRSGKAGGSVYSHNRSGPYIRNRAIPVNPNTSRQVAVRNAMRALTIAWDISLTPAQRAAWDVFGANLSWKNRVGASIFLTGLNHFVRANSPLLINGFARIDAAPTTYLLAAAESALVVTASEATQDASIAFDDTADWCSEDGAYQFVYGGLPVNASKKFFGGPYRLLGVIEGDSITPITSPQVLAWPFPFAEGNRLWCRTRVSRADGRLSEFAETNFLGAA